MKRQKVGRQLSMDIQMGVGKFEKGKEIICVKCVIHGRHCLKPLAFILVIYF